jgi:hypothetical protein
MGFDFGQAANFTDLEEQLIGDLDRSRQNIKWKEGPESVWRDQSAPLM